MRVTLTITIDGEALTVPEDISVVAALALTGDPTTRQAVNGELRAPFYGMGICQKCRTTADGLRVLACQTLCRAGMQIERSHDEHAALWHFNPRRRPRRHGGRALRRRLR